MHSTDAFGTAGGKALTEALGKIPGATVALDQGYANQSQDFTPVVLAIKQSGADILGSYFTFENDLGVFARQLRQLGVTIPYVGSPSIVNVTALKLAGPALYGTFGVADYAEDSSDALESLRQGLSRSREGGARQSVVLDVRRHHDTGDGDQQGRQDRSGGDPRGDPRGQGSIAGAEGEYNFDANGDGLHGYNIVQEREGHDRLRQAHRIGCLSAA